MKKKIAMLILGIVLMCSMSVSAIAAPALYYQTGYYGLIGGLVEQGEGDPMVRVIPGVEKKNAAILIGYDKDITGALNEKGLFIHIEKLETAKNFVADEEKEDIGEEPYDILLKMIQTLGSVTEAEKFFQKNNVPTLSEYQYFFTDLESKSMVVSLDDSGDITFGKQLNYSIIGNASSEDMESMANGLKKLISGEEKSSTSYFEGILKQLNRSDASFGYIVSPGSGNVFIYDTEFKNKATVNIYTETEESIKINTYPISGLKYEDASKNVENEENFEISKNAYKNTEEYNNKRTMRRYVIRLVVSILIIINMIYIMIRRRRRRA